MEAVPRLPMISFEMKASPDRPPTDFGKLKQYIRDFYNEDADTYSPEIRQLETLRATAVRPAKDVTGCSVLKRYFCQLHFLQSRFPMNKEGAAAVSFTWRDTYASMVCTVADIRFEMVSILYNIGALHSQLGAGDNRATAEGLKLACSHFQCAAWAFQHLKDSYPQPAGVDVSPDVMQFMQQLCLAQAQECILEKSMTDNRKATINAKVAAQIVDYYNMALNALVHSGGSDDGSVLETIGAKLFKSWKKYVKFKQTYYGCISLLYQGMQSEEQQKMGERVAYYQAAFDKLTEADRLSNGLDQPEAVAETLAFTMDVVEGKRKGAKNDNEFVYHEKVPERDSLPDVKGASLVKGISFSVNDPDISGPDIFARLVPMKAHEASSLYSEEKAKLLRRVGGMIDEKDQDLVGFISSLQLEHINAHAEPDILPQELIDRCAALSAKPNAIQNLIDAMDRLSGLYHDVEGMLQEILELIKVEEAAEKEYQEVMGSRPPSIVATDLTREANKYREAHTKAAESNETLHKAMAQHIANLRVLSLPLPELHKQLPSISCLNLNENGVVKDVQHLVSKVEEMRRQRSMLATQLRESVCGDDITSQLVTRPSENLQTIFTQELQKHTRYVSLLEQNLLAQDNIVKALTDAYADYSDTRKAVAEIIRQRTMMLSALMSSYDAYEDLIAKSNKGLEFYRKLETNVTKLLQRVKGTCKVQEEERDTILLKNGKRLPSKAAEEKSGEDAKAPAAGGGSGLKLKDYLQNMKKDVGGVYPGAASPALPPAGAVSGPYSAMNYANVQPPRSLNYTEPVPSSETTQPWVPAVRPAPVGSEGTAPVCSNSAKVSSDLKTDVSANYPYPSSANFPSYDPHYYYPSQQSALYSPSGGGGVYPSKAPTVTSTVAGTNVSPPYTAAEHSQTVPATHYGTVQSPYTSTPSSSSPYQTTYQNPANVDPKYQTNPSNAPYSGAYAGTNYAPAALANSNPAGYYQPNADTYGRYQYPYTQQGYGTTTTTSSPSRSAGPVNDPNLAKNNVYTAAVVSDASKPSYAQQSQTNAYPAAASTPYSTTAAAATAYSNVRSQYTPYPAPTGGGGYMYASSTPGYNYGDVYRQPLNAYNNWPNNSTAAQQTPAVQIQQQHNSPQYQQQQIQPPSQQGAQQQYQTAQTVQPQQQSTGTDQKAWAQQNGQHVYGGGYSVPATNTNVAYRSPYNNPAVATPEMSPQYVGQGQQSYYPNASYPQHLQYTPVAGISHYTHAGQMNTSQTNSTQTSVQGRTFAAQYNINSDEGTATAAPTITLDMNQSTNMTYYSQQYGYQLPQYNCNDNSNNNNINNSLDGSRAAEVVVKPVAGPVEQQMPQQQQQQQQQQQGGGQVTPQSPMTYMQASNSALTMTYSQQHNAGPRASNSVEEKNQKPSSNIDLLAGLDFSVSETPLVPEQTTAAPVVKTTESLSSTKAVSSGNSSVLSLIPPSPRVCDDSNAVKPDEKMPESVKVEPSHSSPAPPPQVTSVTTSTTPQVNEPMDTSSSPVVSIPKSESKTKPPAKDPFLDPEVLNQFATEVEKFEKFVDGLVEKTLNGPTPLDIKWKELQEIQEKDSQKQSISVARCYPMKNRFPDILPYDISRVELPSTKDDYINASHVKDISQRCPNFIVTQSPLPSTYADFWTMILEHQVEIVVCLLNDMEMGDNVYWPQVKGQEETVGRVTVSLQSTNVRKHWVERIISVSNGRTARVIVHLQFTEWPGSSFPASPGPFLSLIQETLNVHNQQRCVTGPVVIHCLSGVGRAGLFLVTVAAICEIQSKAKICGLPDLVKLAAAVSTHRKNALHNREHLKFAYQALLYYAQDLLMKRGILTNRSSFGEEKRPKSHTRHPSQDFLLGTPKETGGVLTDAEQTERNGASGGSGGSEGERKVAAEDPFRQIDPMWPIKRFQ